MGRPLPDFRGRLEPPVCGECTPPPDQAVEATPPRTSTANQPRRRLMPSQAQDRPSSTTDPGEQFTTEQANIPHAPEPEAEQLALRFFAVINGYNRIPPEPRAVAGTAEDGDHVVGRVRDPPSEGHAGPRPPCGARDLLPTRTRPASPTCHRTNSRSTATGHKRPSAVRSPCSNGCASSEGTGTSRRDAEIIEMNLGGLSWPAIRMRAKQARRMDQATTSRLNFEQPASPSDGMVPSLSYGTMPSPKGYVPGLVLCHQ